MCGNRMQRAAALRRATAPGRNRAARPARPQPSARRCAPPATLPPPYHSLQGSGGTMDEESQQGFALITGASSGIGAALAREYARRGRPLILTARRRDKLDALAVELSSRVRCEVLVADLADPGAPAALQDETTRRGWNVEVLVNNAGYGLP